MVSMVEGKCTKQCSPTCSVLNQSLMWEVGIQAGKKRGYIKIFRRVSTVIPYSLMEINSVYIIFHDRELNCGTLLFWIRWVARMVQLKLQHVIIK